MQRSAKSFRAAAAALLATACVAAWARAAAALDVDLDLFAGGFTSPVDIANAGDTRLFVVEQDGYIRIVMPDGTVLGTEFLDIDARVLSGGEQGLLGLVFHPDYFTNGYFYVHYTDNSGDHQISRFSVLGDPVTSDVADDTSELPILDIPDPYSNHNGGDLAFGDDGYLYIALGDGGSFNDPDENGQDPTMLLGKMLRIDVDGGSPYAVPADNPFFGPDGVLDEIWALGLRNPWRFSFDRSTYDLWIGDVGQGSREEIDFAPTASTGGENYGWDCYEGNDPFEGAGCGPIGDYTFPVHDYSSLNPAPECAVTGGFVYRGSGFPEMNGYYFFGDFCSGALWSLVSDGGGGWDLESYGGQGINISTFGEDSSGEIYVADLTGGSVYRLESTPEPPSACPVSPAPGCTSPGKSILILKSPGDPSRNKLTWKWLKGPATDPSDFGDPVDGGTGYDLCIYDSGDDKIVELGLPTGTSWATVGDKGYKYQDDAGSNDGVFKVLAKGGDPGKAKVLIKAKGANLDLPTLPLNEPTSITVQLLRNDDPACWESSFSSPFAKDSDTTFKAKQ